MKLRTITPVHIGDGEEIIPWEYSKDTGKVGIFPVEHIIKELTNSYSGQRLRNLLLELRSHVRDFGFSRHLGDFVRDNRLRLNPLYSLECKTSLRDREFKSIKSHIKNVEGVYIPGSEIKGALRTIFIFGVFMDSVERGDNTYVGGIMKAIKYALNPDRRDKDPWKTAMEKVERLFFRYTGLEDAKYDLFKALVVSDSRPKLPEEVLYIDSIHLVGSNNRFSEPHELIKSDAEFDIDIQIDEEHKKALKKVSHNPYIDKLTLEFLQESSAFFYKLLLNEEGGFFQKHNVEGAMNDLVKVSTSRDGGDFILRIGKHQGFLSTTIMLLLKRMKPELYEKVYRELVPKAGSKLNKTRKITSEGRVLGWCALEGG